MSENEALLRAIFNDPEDDAVRLVYADWLEENGEAERAELIRIQIELVGLHPGDPRRDRLTDREEELLEEHSERWEAELPEPKELWGRWRRGFIDEVHGGGPREWAETILAAVPFRRLVLRDWWAYNSLAGSPLLPRMRELEIRAHDHNDGHLDDTDLAQVLSWPETVNLTHLELEGHELTAEGMRALAEARLPRLRSLVLTAVTWRPVRDDILRPLLTADWLTHLEVLAVKRHPLASELVGALCEKLRQGRLRSLTLSSVGLGGPEVVELVRSGLLASVADLDLSENEIGPAGAWLLIDALPSTTCLALDGNPLGAGALKVLAGSPHLERLTRLSFSGPSVDKEGVTALANSPYARRLRWLSLTGGSVDTAAAQALLTSPHLTSLRWVDLDSNRIDALPVCHLSRLESLTLSQNRLDSAGVVAFCAGSRLPVLEHLDFDGNQLGPEAAAALANAPGLNALDRLRLSENALGDEGAKALATGQGLPRLATLWLRNCGIGDEGVSAWMGSPLLSRVHCLFLKTESDLISEEVYRAFQQRALELGCEVY